MTDNTEPTIEQKISDIIASYLVLATDNGQPYIQYDDTAVDKITNLISDQVARARIEETKLYKQYFKGRTQGYANARIDVLEKELATKRSKE